MRTLRILIFLIGCFSANVACGQEEVSRNKSILYVGNSLTKYERNHSLEILSTFLKEKESEILINDFTLNGAILWFLLHNKLTSERRGVLVTDLKNGDLYNQIEQNDYDLIVVQEDSDNDIPFPSFSESLPLLDSLSKNKNIQLVVFENYARYIHKTRTKTLSSHLDDIYDATLTRKAVLLHNLQELDFIPTGYVVKEYRKAYPKSKYTYSIGGTHPSKNIQFLLACVFYKYLTGNDAEALEYNYKLKRDDANAIKQFTDKAYLKYYATYLE